MTQRYEREIDEILRKAGDLGPAPTTTRRPPVQERGTQHPWDERRRTNPPNVGGFWSKLTVNGQIMLASLVLGIIAFVVAQQQPVAGGVLAVAATCCFFVAYVNGWRGPQNIGSERRWRGERVDYDSQYDTVTPFEQLKDWWKRRNTRR